MAAWDRLPAESNPAYAAFVDYYRLPARERSIDAAWRLSNEQHASSGKRAPGRWMIWSGQHDWVERAKAYDAYLAEVDRQRWEDRRRELQERDWSQAARLRDVVDEGIDHSRQFTRRRTSTIRGRPAIMDEAGAIVEAGIPDREIITLEFEIDKLATVAEKASKMQHSATGDPGQSADNPLHTVGWTVEQWQAQQAARRQAAGDTAALFDDADGAGADDAAMGAAPNDDVAAHD